MQLPSCCESLCPNYLTHHHTQIYNTTLTNLFSYCQNIPSLAILSSFWRSIFIWQEQWLWFPSPTDSQPPEDPQGKLNGPTDGRYCGREGLGQTVTSVPQKTWGVMRAVHVHVHVRLCTCIRRVHLFMSVCKYALCVHALAPLWLFAGGGMEGHAGLTQDVWNLLAWQHVTRLLG